MNRRDFLKSALTLVALSPVVRFAPGLSAANNFVGKNSYFTRVPKIFPAPTFQSAISGIRPIFIQGPPWRGKETRIFAWYGLPANASATNPVPGIVLVHGGLGTAFAPWVKRWNDYGFAAIAIDQFCAIPPRDGNYTTRLVPERHDFSGPISEERFNHLDEPISDHWSYHALAATMLANSFLRSLPEVVADKVGITGISWGGYTTALTIGYDRRFAFAMPVYGCGGYAELKRDSVDASKLAKFCSLWDPNLTLANAKMPILWLNSCNDFVFDVWNWNHSASLCARSFRCLKPYLPHSQIDGESSPELPAFARAVVQNQTWCDFAPNSLMVNNLTISAKLNSACDFRKIEVAITRATGCWRDRYFRYSKARYNPSTREISATLPHDWTAAYFSVTDSANLIHTSELSSRPLD